MNQAGKWLTSTIARRYRVSTKKGSNITGSTTYVHILLSELLLASDFDQAGKETWVTLLSPSPNRQLSGEVIVAD